MVKIVLLDSQEKKRHQSSKDESSEDEHEEGENIDSDQGEEESSDDEEQDEEEEEEIDNEQQPEDEDSGEDEDDEDEDDANEDDDDDDEAGIQAANEAAQSMNVASSSGEPCTFDLRNLLAINNHQIDTSKLYSSKKSASASTVTHPSQSRTVNEEYLLDKATEGCQQLISALWQLPMEQSDVGPMVILPSFDESKIPRALPPPEPKKETKWEKFAKEKGIALNKNKRSQKVWDETVGEWKFRHGYNKAGSSAEWPIMEVKANQDPFEDPWERMRDEKKTRVGKNLENRMRNEERAGNLAKGTTNRVMKSKAKTWEAGKLGGNLDRDNVAPPPGVPVDLKARSDGAAAQPAKRGRESTLAALRATQRSTASLGKFDQMRDGEPERKKAMAKKRKFESVTDKKLITSETERSMKMLKAVVEGGGTEREKARKKGKLARGETAYDYEYDDGLGSSTFRKKKGRAGSGKVKKMTKKRAK